MKAIDGKTAPPDSVPRSLHDVWHQGFEAGYEAAQAERPVCAKHKTPKRAHYYCVECREAGENVVIALNNGNTFVFCDFVSSNGRACVRGSGHNGPHALSLPPHPHGPVLLAEDM